MSGRRPSVFFAALSEADEFCADHTDQITEILLLRAENVELRRERDTLIAAINTATDRHHIT